MDIDRMRADRFRFLKALYEASGGDELKWVNMFELGEQLGFGMDYTTRIYQYLSGEQLVASQSMQSLGITHYGIVEIEKALSQPEKPTHYFPPVNIISVGSMINSQIQQASPDAKQESVVGEGRLDEVRHLLEEIKKSVRQIGLPGQACEDVEADIVSAVAQLRSSGPKMTIISECLRSVRAILESAAGSAIAAGLIDGITTILR